MIGGLAAEVLQGPRPCHRYRCPMPCLGPLSKMYTLPVGTYSGGGVHEAQACLRLRRDCALEARKQKESNGFRGRISAFPDVYGVAHPPSTGISEGAFESEQEQNEAGAKATRNAVPRRVKNVFKERISKSFLEFQRVS